MNSEKKINLSQKFKDQLSPQSQFLKKKISGIKKIIAISSAKGGVGKSTISANLSVALAKLNQSVGLLDADIYGPSIPDLFNINEKPTSDENGKIEPIQKQKIKLMSMGFLIEKDSPMVWRGPMVIKAIKMFLDNVNWGNLDYLELFQKYGYAYGKQESYSLNHISYVVLGEKKLSYEESGSLKNLYVDDFQKYIDYNMKDVQLVDRIEDKMGLITLIMTVAYKGGVNYRDAFGVTGIWESIIYRKLNRDKIAPPAGKSDSVKGGQFAGGYVKEPMVGSHDWVVSFDLNSLYPNIIVQWNMSPETLKRENTTTSGVDHYLQFFGTDSDPIHPVARQKDLAVATNGSTYSKEKDGVIPNLIIEYYDDRRSAKNQMLAAEQEYEKEKTYELEKEINRLQNQQMAIKIPLNIFFQCLNISFLKSR